jgi:hypothetical protein
VVNGFLSFQVVLMLNHLGPVSFEMGADNPIEKKKKFKEPKD